MHKTVLVPTIELRKLSSWDNYVPFKKIVKGYTGCPKKLLESGEQYTVVLRFSSAFSRCLTRGKIYAARIVLFKVYIKVEQCFFR